MSNSGRPHAEMMMMSHRYLKPGLYGLQLVRRQFCVPPGHIRWLLRIERVSYAS